MKLSSIEDVYAEQLGSLRSAEQQLVDALPKLADAASDNKLEQAFVQHLAETEIHLERLDRVIAAWAKPVPKETCEAMKSLVGEGEKVIGAAGPDAVKDVALIAVAQCVEHYEIAVYGTARALADQLGQLEARDLLSESLDEESRADELLTKLATGGLIVSGINERAQG